MGGEKRLPDSRKSHYLGSPPRGRGKDPLRLCQPPGGGITPAWAGKRAGLALLLPRAGGSPPRGRGKARGPRFFDVVGGITPAWAGKSMYHRSLTFCWWDHPRVGGEKLSFNLFPFFRQGSPPRGRGKGPRLQKTAIPGGITPAWAGKRLKRSHRSGIFISGPIPFHSVLHRPAGSGGSRAGRDGSPAGQPQNTGPA